ncbi:hypothetical protein RFI_09113, partial [Reticulomyxa filosa]
KKKKKKKKKKKRILEDIGTKYRGNVANMLRFYQGLDGEYWNNLEVEFKKKRDQLNDYLSSHASTGSANARAHMDLPIPTTTTTNGNDTPQHLDVDFTQDKFARQVSLVHEFDERQLQISRQKKVWFFFFFFLKNLSPLFKKKLTINTKSLDIVARWEVIRMSAEEKQPHGSSVVSTPVETVTITVELVEPSQPVESVDKSVEPKARKHPIADILLDEYDPFEHNNDKKIDVQDYVPTLQQT